MSLQVFKAFHMSVKTSTIQKQKQKSSPVKRCQKPQKNKSLHLTAEANVYDLSKPAAWKSARLHAKNSNNQKRELQKVY